MSGILEDVKQTLGVVDDTTFDEDIKMHINTALADLGQLGVGPKTGFEVTGTNETWRDFVVGPRFNAVKSYVYLRVRLLFDPPTSGFVTKSMEEQINRMEFRLYAEAYP